LYIHHGETLNEKTIEGFNNFGRRKILKAFLETRCYTSIASKQRYSSAVSVW